MTPPTLHGTIAAGVPCAVLHGRSGRPQSSGLIAWRRASRPPNHVRKTSGSAALLAGFHQAYTYACEFNEPVAYLVIYKLCPEVLRLELPNSTGQFPSMVLNNKTVFFVVIDVCDQPPPSKRGGVKTIDITAEDLIRAAEAPEAA